MNLYNIKYKEKDSWNDLLDIDKEYKSIPTHILADNLEEAFLKAPIFNSFYIDELYLNQPNAKIIIEG